MRRWRLDRSLSSVMPTVARAMRAAAAADPSPPAANFEWRAYVDNHSDLMAISSAEAAIEHYLSYGKAEGRLATNRAIADRIAKFEDEHGALPAAFAWREYVANYRDLAFIKSSYEAAQHYLKYGRGEGRAYVRFQADIYRSLYFHKVEIPDDQLLEHYLTTGRPAGLIASVEQIAAQENIENTFWLDALRVDEFNLLNWSWAGEVTNKLQAARAMVREGFDRLAPISFSHEFDPDYYAEANPGLARLSKAERYRQWLFAGMEGGRPGTPADHLARHGLKLSGFPDGFDWERYAKLPGVFGDSRWALLDHVVANNAIAAGDVPTRDPGAAEFLAALATTVTPRLAPRGLDLFAEASRKGQLTPADDEHWGDGFAGQERWGEALACYRRVIAAGAAQVPVVVAAARAAIRLGDSEAAFDLLWDGRTASSGDVRWRDALRETIEKAFATAWRAAERLYAQGRRAEADGRIAAVVADIERRWTSFDPIGLPLPPEALRRTVMLANVDLRQCTHYRVEQKKEIFAAAGLLLEVFTQAEVDAFITALPGASAAIFYRLPATPMNIRAITVCRALDIPSYYDIDDLIFDAAHYPEPIETYGASVDRRFYESLQLGVPLFRAAMTMCDYAVASTTLLADTMAPLVRLKRAFVLPNGIDSNNSAYLDTLIPKVRRNDDVVLFYGSGTKAHNSDFLDLLGGPLLTLMSRHAHVRLIVTGFLTLDARFDPVRDRIVQLGWTKDVESFWSLLAEADINLAVLIPSPTTDCKSEIKWLEAAAMGVPSIVSATHRYSEVLEDGVDAILARTSEEWLDGLQRLVEDPALRRAIVEAARAKARAFYSVEANAERLTTLLEPAFARSAAKSLTVPRKKRLLLVNIFFPPQTVGGSTRVVRDNLDSFLASSFAEECDFAVVTAENNLMDPYRLRIDNYRGVPVFRMSTNWTPRMEWAATDERNGAMFARILELWKPDLVHFHAVQRMTASIIEECYRADIPYINTVHDAWWLSDYMFLTNERGEPLQPEDPLPLNAPYGVSVGESLERRRRLRFLLENSAEILGVSEAFTKILHEAGYRSAKSVPNGVPPLAPVVRTRSTSGRVRLTQMGGHSHHKGYHLVQAAIKQGRFKNLELTVLDHWRFGGRTEWTVWGETQVKIVGKTKQEDMHIFYRDQDVLLAPSVWPESFGLVSREATAAGLWVVASDRGAIGEGIEHGVNGWVVDVSTLGPFLQVLEEINAAPERYLQSPPSIAAKARTAGEQARELAEIYRAIFRREATISGQRRFTGEPIHILE